MKINLFGDLCQAETLFVSDGIKCLMKNSVNIINLEGPITNGKKNISKAGPHLKGSGSFLDDISGYSKNTVICLSNNHIMDYGEEGANQTIKKLYNIGADFTGIGIGENSNKPFLLESDSKTIAVLNRCEEQFGLADMDKLGAAKIDATIYSQVLELKKKVDCLIVSIHAASEMFPWPSPDHRKFLHSLVDAGADIVHGHHSHIPQCFEKYGKGYIFYGLGNFIVDYNKWKNIKNATWSLVPVINIDKDIRVEVKYTKIYKNDKDELCIGVAEDFEVKEFNDHMKEINAIVKDSLLLRALWQENSAYLFDKYYEKYILSYYKEKKSGIFNKRKEILKDYNLLYHLFSCVSHKDAIKEALGIYCGEIPDYRTKESSELFNKYGSQ